MGFDIGENDKGEMMTTKGLVDKHFLTRKTIFEDRPDAYVVSVEWVHAGEMVRRDALPAPKSFGEGETVSGTVVYTIDGLKSADSLIRTLTHTEDDEQFTIIRRFTEPGTNREMRKDVHIILKRASEAASAVAGGLG